MNESAQISSVKSLSVSDDEVQMHLKAISRHQKAIRVHLKAILSDDDELSDDDGTPADDPALLEANDDDDDPADEGMSKAFLQELQTLATQAGELRR